MEKTIYKTQNTARFSPSELEFIDENYYEIANTEDKIPFSKFCMKAFVAAVSSNKPKTIEVSKQSDLDKIANLNNKIEELTASLESKIVENNALNEALETSNQNTTPKEAIVLKFAPKWRKYIWGVLQVSKKVKFANSYEELIEKIFKVVNKRGELILNEEDYQYLDTLQYDLPEETKEEKEND